LIYLGLAFLQEALIRGVFQTVLEKILSGRNRHLFAVLIPAGLFASMHLSYSIEIALVSLLLGIFWRQLFFSSPHTSGCDPFTLAHCFIGLDDGNLGILF